jgi:3-oxoadipate enol-lactonase/4-carboxymuconolactone decarboxylase
MTAVPAVAMVRLGPSRPSRPLLVLGPSLGTTATTLWDAAAARLADDFDVVGWDLPGHGASEPPKDGFTLAEVARGVLAAVQEVLADRGEPGGTFAYAGDSVGGAVGLQLLLDAPGRVTAATLLCTGAKIGTAASWAERAATVRAGGTEALVEASAGRWFGPGFIEREPATAQRLLDRLAGVDDEGYVRVCEALGEFDVRDRLGEVGPPVLAVAGATDPTTPPDSLRLIAEGVPDGRLVVLDGVSHLAPAEAPDTVARLITAHPEPRTVDGVHAAGMAVRRAVLGDGHVDRASAAVTDLTRDFQDLITRYAWGSVWTRPGLDRRSRSMITLTALVALGHDDELALHLRAARRNGLTDAEIAEVLLQAAIYCGVPAANTAFRIAQRVLAEED